MSIPLAALLLIGASRPLAPALRGANCVLPIAYPARAASVGYATRDTQYARRPTLRAHPGGRTAAVAQAAMLTFRPQAEVRGSAIHLGDVALVESNLPRLLARLAAVEVGTAPLAGHSRTVSAEYAKVRIRQAGVDESHLRFSGPELITVTRPEQLLAGTALQKAACEAVEAVNPGAAVQLTSAPSDLHLPCGTLTLKPQPVSSPGSASGTVKVQVLVDDHQETMVTLGYQLVQKAPVIVAKRDLLVGTVLTENDLRVEDRPVVPGPLVLSDVSLAAGQQAAVPIKGGTSITAAMLKPAVLIKRGTPVKLICRGPTFMVTVTAEALEDGTAGQPVRLRNLSSLREVTGLVVGEQTAEVPF